MTEHASQEPILRLSNGSDAGLLIWFEPWCDEISLPPRAELEIVVEGRADAPEVQIVDDHLAIYGAAGTRLHVHIDGVKQHTASSEISVPATGMLSTRTFVDMAFGAVPEARAAGVPLPQTSSGRRWFPWPFWRRR